MALLTILEFPDPRLRKVAAKIDRIDDEVRNLASDMLETMYDAPGIGLAATQVNVHRRMLVCDVSEDKSDPLVLVNPEILQRDGEEEMQEGCLSVPGEYETVQRADSIRLSYLNLENERLEMEASGLLAVCIQHEIDHLDGKLFVDYLSPLKRSRIRKRLEKQQRMKASA